MAIVRRPKTEKYFKAANEPFNDKRLSWEARGMLGYLLSKPDNWEVRQYDLVAHGPAGEHKVRRVVKELERRGYLARRRLSTSGGRFTWVTTIFETPDLNQ